MGGGAVRCRNSPQQAAHAEENQSCCQSPSYLCLPLGKTLQIICEGECRFVSILWPHGQCFVTDPSNRPGALRIRDQSGTNRI